MAGVFGKLRTRCPVDNGGAPGYRSFGWLPEEGESPGAGAVSTGFWVSVGWPVTSPGRDDMPGSLLPSFVGLGLAGRETLPEEAESVLEAPGPVRVSVADPAPEPVSVPEVVGLFGAAGLAGLVFVSSAFGVPEGEVRVRCIPLDPLRPWAPGFLWCFFAFLPLFEDGLEIDSFPLPLAAAPLLTSFESRFEVLSGCSCGDFAAVSPPGGEVLAAGSLLGSVLLLDEVFDELPGRALLF